MTFTKQDLEAIATGIRERASQDGHPEDWDVRVPLPGVSAEVSEKAFAILSQDDEFLPKEIGSAVARWLRLCAEFGPKMGRPTLDGVKRVPLNCLVHPETKDALKKESETSGNSIGQLVDKRFR